MAELGTWYGYEAASKKTLRNKFPFGNKDSFAPCSYYLKAGRRKEASTYAISLELNPDLFV